MAEKKYKNAPISEVIIGLNFKESILNHEDILKIYNLLADEFKFSQILPPLNEETLVEGDLRLGVVSKNLSGAALYRFRTEDKQWLLQVQQNKIYLNWIRPDNTQVGNYPGFTQISNKYYELIDIINKDICTIDFNKLKYCELTYNDRISLQNEMENLKELAKIMNIEIPSFLLESNRNNKLNLEFSHPILELNAYTTNTIRSIFHQQNIEILQFEKSVKIFANSNYKKYFKQAHDIQIDIFEQLFTEEVKKQWN